MSYKILLASKFVKELKRLNKKYPSLKKEMAKLAEELYKNHFMGAALGNNCYKIRISIASKGGGKSGGARVITHLKVSKETVYLLSIYDKAEQANISDKEIKDRISSL